MEPIEWKLFADAPDAPVVVLLTGEGEGEAVYAGARERTEVPFALLSVAVSDWDADLTPWPAEPLWKGSAPYAGGAEHFLERLCAEVLPAASGAAEPPYLALVGYSLAGLFALWTAYRTDRFARIGSVSGSLWYPGMREFVLERELPGGVEALWLSVGDREARTRNAVLRTVEDNTRDIARRWAAGGRRTTFTLHAGNHFQHAAERTAEAVAWLLEAQNA